MKRRNFLINYLIVLALLSVPETNSGQPATVSHKVRVARLPNPVFKVIKENSSTGNINKGGPVVAGEDGSDLSGILQIKSFSVTVIHNGQTIYQRNYQGCKYDEELLKALDSAVPGDMILWEDIKVFDPDKVVRMLASVRSKKMAEPGLWKIASNSTPCVKY